MKKHLIMITSHPEREKSLCYANAKALEKSAKKQGYEVRRFEAFDFPCMNEDPSKSGYPPDFDEAVEALLEADQIVLVSPMWNLGAPWAVKNFIDGVSQARRLFQFHPPTKFHKLLGIGNIEGYLKAKCLHCIWTSGSNAKMLNLGGYNGLYKQMKLSFGYMGIKKFRQKYLGGIRPGRSDAECKQFIKELESYKF